VEGHVSESAAEINLKLEEEIGLTKSRIDLVGTSVDEMQEFLRGIQAQVDKLQTNLQYANRGILMLCSIVGSLPQQEKRTRRYEYYFTNSNVVFLPNSSSICTFN